MSTFKAIYIGVMTAVIITTMANAEIFSPLQPSYASINIKKDTNAIITWSEHNYRSTSTCSNPITRDCNVTSADNSDTVTFVDANHTSSSCIIKFSAYDGITQIVNNGMMKCDASYGQGNHSTVTITETGV